MNIIIIEIISRYLFYIRNIVERSVYMIQPCLAIIHNKYNQLTAAEKKIADYVLSNPDKATNTSVVELASKCNVAASAVNRFCKTLEYAGFREFKMALAVELGNDEKQKLLPAVNQNDDVPSIFSKVFQSSIRTLQDTQALLDFQMVEKAVAVLDAARQTLLFGIGTSATVALDAQYRLMQLGYRVNAFSDILYMRVAAMNIQKGDVAIGFSHSGETHDTVETLRLAKENGATTIAITSFKDSSISKHADFTFSVYSDERNYPVEAVSARTAHMCFMDAIIVALTVNHFDEVAEHLKKRNAVLKELRK